MQVSLRERNTLRRDLSNTRWDIRGSRLHPSPYRTASSCLPDVLGTPPQLASRAEAAGPLGLAFPQNCRCTSMELACMSGGKQFFKRRSEYPISRGGGVDGLACGQHYGKMCDYPTGYCHVDPAMTFQWSRLLHSFRAYATGNPWKWLATPQDRPPPGEGGLRCNRVLRSS